MKVGGLFPSYYVYSIITLFLVDAIGLGLCGYAHDL